MTSPEGSEDARTGTVMRLRRGGVEIVAALEQAQLPRILHWGEELQGDIAWLDRATARGVSSSALDHPWPFTLMPTEVDGWQGRPGLSAHRQRHAVLPRWEDVRVDSDGAGLHAVATADGLALEISLRLDDAGVAWWRATLTNTGDGDLDVSSLEAVMPVGDAASEVLDFSGRWTRERSPQRGPLREGTRVRETRRGRTGHDSPLLTIAGEAGFGPSRGQVWAVHAAWSADAVHRVDALPEASTAIGAGALLRAGEIVLAPGEQHQTPEIAFAWSDQGLDGLGSRMHASARSRHEVTGPRPVTLNTWEAVYFHHDLDRLRELATLASELGVERFVLDDGWFTGRRSDRTSLGDWTVDREVWPEGLGPLVSHVRERGMQFGLWFEPEMVSPDSELAAQHPDWLLGPPGGPTRTWRHQHVLDLARPEAAQHLLEAISAIVDEYDIDYIKWDQNRDLLEATHDDRAGTFAHTEAVYGLIDALRERHPRLEIESCASGGARIDLGILARTDRVWASDTNDPLERVDIQRWTELLVPPERIGSHIGPASAHTTYRQADLSLRIATAFMGHFGIEWDLTEATAAERAQVKDAIAAHIRLRPLLHTGQVSHPDAAEPGLRLTSVVATDRMHALLRIVRVHSDGRALPALVRIPGLDPQRSYRVRPVPELPAPRTLDVVGPPWCGPEGVELSGSALAAVGIRPPLLGPGQALMLEVTAEQAD